MDYEVAPQSGITLRCCEFGGVTDWYQSTGYRELGRFQNLDYNRFSKNFKGLSPLSDIRARILPAPSPPPLHPYHAATPPPLHHGRSRCLSTTVTTTNATTTAATAAAFPATAAAAVVAGCGWQFGYHRHDGAYKSPRSRAVRRQTTIVVAVERRYNQHSRTLWCRAVMEQPLVKHRGGQPPKTTTVVAAKPTTATTAAPWLCRACGGAFGFVDNNPFRGVWI
uniref:Uncharacterized protein n=1 Tax=Tanacetum cinerariifolium TaxID=118510 RepID=A0A6L2L3S4_TANCI|nr:hypothetical protein [Tanacetum cinerariifolium]